LFGGLDGTQGVLPERVEHMANEGGSVTMDELLMLFKDAQCSRGVRTKADRRVRSKPDTGFQKIGQCSRTMGLALGSGA
jgi:hypothetical protein